MFFDVLPGSLTLNHALANLVGVTDHDTEISPLSDMAYQFEYILNWKVKKFTTRRDNVYSKQFWPFEGRVYNPRCIVSSERERGETKENRKREVTKFYLKFDGALPEGLRVQWIIRLKGIDDSLYLADYEERLVEHGRVLLFYVVTKGETLRVAHKVMEYSREHDYIEMEFTFHMLFENPVPRVKPTTTPVKSVLRKRRCNLCSDFKNLYDSKEMADVTITVDGVSLLAHKLVLVTRSPVFKAMFDNDCLESNAITIQVTDADASIFDNFLKCLYCSEIGDKSYDMVRNLYMLADKYAVDDLKEDCRDILESEFSSTVCQLLEMSHLFRDKTLSEKAVDYFKQHFSAVSKNPE